MSEHHWDSITQTARRILQRQRETGDPPPEHPATEPAPEPETPPVAESGPAAVSAPERTALSAQQFEDLLERSERILLIHSREPEATLRQFESVAHHSGKAVYLWNADVGLSSLKVNDMGVPGSTRMTDALRYISNSRHYGIYAFVNFEPQLNLSCTQLMQEIAKTRSGYDRKVILIGEEFRLPVNLLRYAARVYHEPERKLRLRDGRWVI